MLPRYRSGDGATPPWWTRVEVQPWQASSRLGRRGLLVGAAGSPATRGCCEGAWLRCRALASRCHGASWVGTTPTASCWRGLSSLSAGDPGGGTDALGTAPCGLLCRCSGYLLARCCGSATKARRLGARARRRRSLAARRGVAGQTRCLVGCALRRRAGGGASTVRASSGCSPAIARGLPTLRLRCAAAARDTPARGIVAVLGSPARHRGHTFLGST